LESEMFSSINCSDDRCNVMTEGLKKSTDFFVKSNRMPKNNQDK
jgi:hypothetical protein